MNTGSANRSAAHCGVNRCRPDSCACRCPDCALLVAIDRVLSKWVDDAPPTRDEAYLCVLVALRAVEMQSIRLEAREEAVRQAIDALHAERDAMDVAVALVRDAVRAWEGCR